MTVTYHSTEAAFFSSIVAVVDQLNRIILGYPKTGSMFSFSHLTVFGSKVINKHNENLFSTETKKFVQRNKKILPEGYPEPKA